MKKAILIDPFIPSVHNVPVGDFKDIQKYIGCDIFTCVRSEALDDNVLYLDDEGLINGTTRAVQFIDEIYPQPLAGRILVLGDDGMGGDKDCTLSCTGIIGLIKGICKIAEEEVSA
jgi:hypothetical protein